MTKPHTPQVITVTLNPAIDQTITINEFTSGSVNRVESVRENPGGKGINVASSLADYGIDVAATGFLGQDNVSIFEDLFEQKKISDHFIRLPGETRVGIKITDPILGETTDINFPGLGPQPDRLIEFQKQIDQLSAQDNLWFVLTGSIPPGIDSAIYRDLTRKLRERGHTVILDTSGEPLQLALEAKPHIIKPNVHELEDLLGRQLPSPDSIIEAAQHIVGYGIELVTVSMGEKGALFVTADEVVTARPPEIPVCSTVGAGDAMVAGIVAGYIRELPLEECARLATAFSVNVLTLSGRCDSEHEKNKCAIQEIVPLVNVIVQRPARNSISH